MDEATAPTSLISSPEGVLTVLVAVAAGFFYLEQKTGWRLFEFLPPLLFIYATPVLLNNVGFIPSSSPVYDVLRGFGLPMFICLMLISVDVGAAVRIMGKGVLVMLLGTAGVVVGAVVSYLIVHRWLADDAWTGFGALAGSWIGGTGNMAAVADMVGTSEEQFGLAVVADTVVYVVWLPIMLGSKAFADRFNRWARVDENRLARMEEAAARETKKEQRKVVMRDYLYLGVIAAAVTWVAGYLSSVLPQVYVAGWSEPIISAGVWKILLITTFGIALSFTPVRRIPGAHEVAMAIVYVFVARMGAQASLAGLEQAPAFLAGAYLWIFIHGGFCLLGAWLFRVDVHSTAIASAANIGGAASAPIVAAAHRRSLVPVSILMALIGYAIGNYVAWMTALLCKAVAGQ